MKFDVVFSNPPYNTGKSSGTDLEIMKTVLPFSNEIIFIHPSTWLYDYEKRDEKSNAVKSLIETKVKSIEILPVDCFNGIQLPNKLDIIHIDNVYNGDISVTDIGKKLYTLNSIYDFTPLGENYKVSKKFFQIVSDHISSHGSLFDHTVNVSGIPRGKFEHDGEWYVQLADVIGQPDRPENFGFLLKDYEKNLGIRKSGYDENGHPIFKEKNGKQFQEEPIDNSFKFPTQNEAINFINYLRTDFARFCLVLIKKGKDLNCGQMKFVPWLDFTQNWDDAKLFAYFNIDQNIQQIIDDFIPPYYGI